MADIIPYFPRERNGLRRFPSQTAQIHGEIPFFWSQPLTTPGERGRIPSKLDRSDRGAAFISTAPARPGSRRVGKGPPPKCRDDACPSGAGSSGHTCRTVTNLCEALSMAVRECPSGASFRIFHGPLDKAVHFLFTPLPAAGVGRTPETPRRFFGKVNEHEETSDPADGPGHDRIPGRLRRQH